MQPSLTLRLQHERTSAAYPQDVSKCDGLAQSVKLRNWPLGRCSLPIRPHWLSSKIANHESLILGAGTRVYESLNGLNANLRVEICGTGSVRLFFCYIFRIRSCHHDEFLDFPQMVINASGHCGAYLRGLVLTAKIVIHHMQAN